MGDNDLFFGVNHSANEGYFVGATHDPSDDGETYTQEEDKENTNKNEVGDLSDGAVGVGKRLRHGGGRESLLCFFERSRDSIADGRRQRRGGSR